MRGIPAWESPRGRWTIARGGGRAAPGTPGGGFLFSRALQGRKDRGQGWRERRRRGRNPRRRGPAALSWLSLPGAEAAVGLPPSLRPRPRQWHPVPGASLSSAPFQGFRSPLRGSLHPWLCSDAPLRGLPWAGMPRFSTVAAHCQTPRSRLDSRNGGFTGPLGEHSIPKMVATAASPWRLGEWAAIEFGALAAPCGEPDWAPQARRTATARPPWQQLRA